MSRCLTEQEKKIHALADKMGVTRAYAASLVRREEAAERAKPPKPAPLKPKEKSTQFAEKTTRQAFRHKPRTGK